LDRYVAAECHLTLVRHPILMLDRGQRSSAWERYARFPTFLGGPIGGNSKLSSKRRLPAGGTAREFPPPKAVEPDCQRPVIRSDAHAWPMLFSQS
jgi:hypothetical protein